MHLTKTYSNLLTGDPELTENVRILTSDTNAIQLLYCWFVNIYIRVYIYIYLQRRRQLLLYSNYLSVDTGVVLLFFFVLYIGEIGFACSNIE